MSSQQPNKNTENKGVDFAFVMSMGLQMGLMIALPLIAFLGIGIWIDKKFETFPLFLIVMMIIGFISTFFEVRYVLLPFLKKRSQKRNNKDN